MDYIQQALANVRAMYKISPRSNEPVKQQLARTLAERNAQMKPLTEEEIADKELRLRLNDLHNPRSNKRRQRVR